MGTLSQEVLQDINEIMSEFGNPTFVWNSSTYPCIASLSQFNRNLVEGGFIVEQMLTITIPRYDLSGNATFPNDVLPEAQQLLTFNSKKFRIENVKIDSIYDYDSNGNQLTNGSRIRIVAVGITRGL